MSATTTPAFAGFTTDAIDFLAELAANNDRAWFQPRKAEYERLLREPMQALIAELAARFERLGIPLRADPSRSMFRIYRDTRFARDKSPYKTNVGATFPWLNEVAGVAVPDETIHGNGGYFHFEPGNMYVGGGIVMPERPTIEAFRRAVVQDPDRVAAALEDRGFLRVFDPIYPHGSLKRVPPGYPPHHPRADWLRWKDIVFGRRLTADEVLSPRLPDVLAECYAAALPVFRFLATLRS